MERKGKHNTSSNQDVYRKYDYGGEKRDYYREAMRTIDSDFDLRKKYEELSSNESWKERFCDYLKEKKTLPLLYDPFFKAIFNPETKRGRLSDLVSAMLGQRVDIIEVLPTEESTLMGTLIIMDMLVRLEDGSLADIEVQKVPYLFPAERISCYSSDLLMRQYNRMKNLEGSNRKFSYKDLRKVHTIIFYESSSTYLKSMKDEKLYFHVGKTKFNTEIDIELLQEFHLISLDTFGKYRYPNIIHGDTEVTGYDYDESAYRSSSDDEIKQHRLMYLSLFVTENVDDMERLLAIYPDLVDIVNDMNRYLTKPEEVLNMYSESLRILDKNSVDLLIDEAMEKLYKALDEVDATRLKLAETEAKVADAEAKVASAEAEAEKAEAKVANAEAKVANAEAKAEKAEAKVADAEARAEEAESEVLRLKAELKKLKNNQ
jgi:hypothetical protein